MVIDVFVGLSLALTQTQRNVLISDLYTREPPLVAAPGLLLVCCLRQRLVNFAKISPPLLVMASVKVSTWGHSK